MLILVSFAGTVVGRQRNWKRRQRHLHRSALEHGFDRAEAWTRRRLRRTSFYREHQVVLDEPRGAGLWAWKPYIVLETLLAAPRDAVVVYWDVGRGRAGGRHKGHEVRGRLDPLLDWCLAHNDAVLPGVYIPEHGPNQRWTKRDCFVGMGCDEPRFWRHPQVQATFSLWTRTDPAVAFLREWMTCCTDPRLVSDGPNQGGLPDLPGFVEHRHDQSILTNLVLRHGLRAYGDPHEPTPDSKDLNSLVERVRRDRAG